MVLSLKTYVLAKDKSEWKTGTFTKVLSKTTKDTAQEFVNLLAGLSTKVNGETTSLKAMVFFTLDRMRLLKEDLTKGWFQTVNQSKSFLQMVLTMRATFKTTKDKAPESATTQTAISMRANGQEINVLAEEK